MANSNPYLKEERNSVADNASKVSAVAGGAGAAATIFNNIVNPLKWFAKDSPLGALTQTGIISTIAAGVAAIPDAIEAVQELGKGNVVGAGRKVVRGACNAAITVLPLTAIANVASEMMTGNSLVDHMGNMANGITGTFTGGNKTKDAKVEGALSVPATAAVIGGGVIAAGLAANHFKGKDGTEYTAGGLPNGANGKISSSEPQAIKGVAQVASVDYPRQKAMEQDNTAQMTQQEQEQVAQPREGMPENYWQKRMTQQGIGKEGRAMMAQQNSGAMAGVAAESGNSIFANAANNAVSFTQKEATRDEQRELAGAQVG